MARDQVAIQADHRNLLGRITWILLLLGCSRRIYTTSEVELPSDKSNWTRHASVVLDDYWAALRSGAFTRAIEIAEDAQERALAQGAEALAYGRTDEAIKRLSSITNSKTGVGAWALSLRSAARLQAGEYHLADEGLDRGEFARTWGDVLSAFASPSPEERTIERSVVQIRQLAFGPAVLPVFVNGRQYRFVLDTGASFTIIRPSIAAQIGVPVSTSPATVVVNGGSDRAGGCVVDLRCGSTSFKRHRCLVMATRFKGFDGILGWNFIKHLRICVDFRKKLAVLGPSSRRRGALPNLFWLDEPFVRTKLQNGAQFLVVLDTGTDGPLLRKGAPGYLVDIGVVPKGDIKQGIAIHTASAAVLVPILRLGVGDARLVLRNVVCDFSAPWGVLVKEHMLLGSASMRDTGFVLDFPAGRFEILAHSQSCAAAGSAAARATPPTDAATSH